MRMLRWLSIAIIFSAISACSKPPEQALPRGTRVLALGDSLTAGNGVLPAERTLTTRGQYRLGNY
ncbi:MAG: hypothetical protein IPJ25_08295 [Rhodocyclaceae bacterium]|nr:hypothetical protein [Rhodocyclaceae bacterium]